MPWYDVIVEHMVMGRVRVQADNENDAYARVVDTHHEDWDVDWGPCGDYYNDTDEVEESWDQSPPVDPEYQQYLRLKAKFDGNSDA